jgi:DNA-binding PadR family transcriptional regulator
VAVSSVRLYILGILARSGPMHGHRIRREAQVERTELWTDIKVGSLYAALGRMAAEGSIEPVRTERSGNLPARTVYAITDEGRRELTALRAAALHEVKLRPDPVDLALQYGDDLGLEEVRAAFVARRTALQAQLDSWQQLQKTATPHLRGAEPLCLEHQRLRLEAELTWHDAVIAELPSLLATDPATPG